MGKKMVGEELHFEDIKSIQAFVTREGCPPKEKKKKKLEERRQVGEKRLIAQAKKIFSCPKKVK
jgi:hypothetical protein